MRPGFIVLTVSLLACGRRDFNEADAALPPVTPDAVAPDAPATCPASYSLNPTTGIHYSASQPAVLVNWVAAKTACLEAGQQLARPRSALEALTLANQAEGEIIWVDISMVSTPGVWSDNEGQPVTYLPWPVGRPDGAGDCARMHLDGEIRDTSCVEVFAYLCECRLP